MISAKGDLDWSRRDVTNCEHRGFRKIDLSATLLARESPDSAIANSRIANRLS